MSAIARFERPLTLKPPALPGDIYYDTQNIGPEFMSDPPARHHHSAKRFDVLLRRDARLAPFRDSARVGRRNHAFSFPCADRVGERSLQLAQLTPSAEDRFLALLTRSLGQS